MTMTIEKIEFPRRETKQSKSKKSLTIDSDDEPLETIGEIDPVIEQLKADKSLEPEHSLEDDKSFETEEPQKPDRSSASLELSATENSNIPNDQLRTQGDGSIVHFAGRKILRNLSGKVLAGSSGLQLLSVSNQLRRFLPSQTH